MNINTEGVANFQEGNKLIAEFMGETGLTKVSNDKIVPYDKSYNYTWGNLMPVVEKISTIQFTDESWKENPVPYYDYAWPRTFGMRNEQGQYMVRLNASTLHTADKFIDAVYLAVVDFIQQYNSQSK